MTTRAESGHTLLLWRDDTPRPGWANMARDRALLDLAVAEGALVLRLYRWAPHCLSFGRHEPALRRYARDRIAERGIATVRRPTGGRAVWHARELTYAVAGPEAALGSLATAYHRIHSWLAAGLRTLGAAAELAHPPARTPRPGDGACFAAPVGGEVLVAGFKVVGSAQVREGGALLQHGSMLLEDDQALVRELALEADPRPPAECPLSALLGRRVPWEEAADAVSDAVRGAWPGQASDHDLGTRLTAREAAWAAHFQDDAWTWQR